MEGCSSDNNDFETGGVGNAATPTAGGLAQVVPALEYFFKPLWEAHADVMTIYLGLANSGAGAFLQFPAQVPRSLGTYSSIGCAWAVSAGVLTLSETDRCNAEGAQVGSRDYNPLERGWCRDQVENRGYSRNDGPYLDATAGTFRCVRRRRRCPLPPRLAPAPRPPAPPRPTAPPSPPPQNI